MEKSLTIMCCYTNSKQLADFLKSIETQTEKCDTVLIDNRNGKYKSCSAAFNANLSKVKTKYVIFSHQDILLTKNDQLKNFGAYLSSIGPYDILGVAGGERGGKYVITNIKHGVSRNKAGLNAPRGMEKVDVVDECFFGGTTECFKKYPFDENLCPGWHLYAVERSLAALSRGNFVYVCDVDLEHASKGKINHVYNVDFYRVSKRYSKDIDYIRTTCAYAKTGFPYREWAYIKREISVLLGRY